MRISEIAKMLGKTPADTYVDVLIESGGSCSASSFTMCEDDVMTVIKHPRAMVCTDSSVAKNSKVYHPRLRGTFPRAIRKYAREEKILSLAELIRKMTSLPAHVYGLKTKGLIAEGYDADLCIFDFDKLTDKADYTNCEARAEGLCYVICGGEIIAENAICTGKTPGKLLRRKH
jgi:N-acyl-D-amino-acid deacylase